MIVKVLLLDLYMVVDEIHQQQKLGGNYDPDTPSLRISRSGVYIAVENLLRPLSSDVTDDAYHVSDVVCIADRMNVIGFRAVVN